MSALLEARGVSKSFGGVRAVAGVDWRLDAGEICGVVGPNGSGKTTFFNCLSGYYRLTAGSVHFDGANVTREPMRRRARRGLARTFQHAAVFTSLSPRVHLQVTHGSRLTDEEIDAALTAVGLEALADQPAGALSFGKRRLLGVAMAAATRPRVLLLDEPTSGLNDAESTELAEYLRLLRQQGITIALVDHHMNFLLPLCDRMLLLRTGEKLWEGTPDEFVHDPVVISTYLGADTAGAH